MRIRLTRRLANFMDGIDMSRLSVGDVIDVAPHDGAMLIAEGWAVRVESTRRHSDRRAAAADELDRPSTRKPRRR